jgi:hypothetical protein
LNSNITTAIQYNTSNTALLTGIHNPPTQEALLDRQI